MPPFTPVHTIECLNTYFAALGILPHRVTTAIASVVDDLLAERLEAEIRARLDGRTVTELLAIRSAVSTPALATVTAKPCCRHCGLEYSPDVRCCALPTYPEFLPADAQPDIDVPVTPHVPLCDLLPGGNRASKPRRSNK